MRRQEGPGERRVLLVHVSVVPGHESGSVETNFREVLPRLRDAFSSGLGPAGSLDRHQHVEGAAVVRGYFIVGDAAVVLDPAGSHGVLRALMSGMMAAQTSMHVLAGAVDEDAAAHHYCDWMAAW